MTMSNRKTPIGDAQPETSSVAWALAHRRPSVADSLRRSASWLRSTAIIVPGAILALIVLVCFLGPTIFHLPAPAAGDLKDNLLGFGVKGHLLGTNALGNDMLSQALNGGQISLIIGVSATAIGLVVGGTIGMVAGYYQRVVGAVLMRILDIVFAFPDIILALAISAYLGPSVDHTIWAIGFFSIAGFGRIARAQTLRIVNMDFVVIARASGRPGWKIIATHLWPNIAGPVMAYALIAVGYAMIAEAALSFLGLGVPSPTPSWGNMISNGQDYLAVVPSLVAIPAVLLFLTIASANLLSDGLQARRGVSR